MNELDNRVGLALTHDVVSYNSSFFRSDNYEPVTLSHDLNAYEIFILLLNAQYPDSSIPPKEGFKIALEGKGIFNLFIDANKQTRLIGE